MRIFRVVMQGPDGPPTKEPGKRSQPLRNEESFFAARTVEQVWDYVTEMRRGPWAELEFIKIEEAAPMIHVLAEPVAEGVDIGG